MADITTNPNDLVGSPAGDGGGTMGGGSLATNTGSPPPGDGSSSPSLAQQFPGSSGGFDISKYLPQSLGGTGTPNQSLLIPAWATALQQYNNAGKYTGMAEKYAGQLDPFGSQRGQYQQQLAQLMADPSSISKMPSYQAALQLGLGALNRGNMTKSGTVTNADDIQYASQLGSQTYNNMVSQLSNLSGAQFGPGAAAAILQTGMQGNIQSQNAALQDMFYPFGPSMGGTTVNNTSGGQGGGSPVPGQTPGFNPPPGATSVNWGGQQWVKGPSGDWQPANAAPINAGSGGMSPGNDTGTSDTGGQVLFPPGSSGVDMGPPVPDFNFDPNTYGMWQP